MCSFRVLLPQLLLMTSVVVLVNQPASLVDAGENSTTVPVIKPEFVCKASTGEDQDDMCVWVHPKDPALSTIITADKTAGQLFVYDLTGKQLHSVKASKPGNIDIRSGFPLGDQKVSLVVCNQREGELKLLAYRVDPETRKLIRVDNGKILTKENYGGTMYHSHNSGKFYFFSTTKDSGLKQYELFDNGSGKVAGKKVRQWNVGKSEGAVADDQAGVVYVGEEEGGVWKIDAEPDSADKGEHIIKIGEHGLKGDVEGMALYTSPTSKSYLIISDQGRSQFLVFDRAAQHKYVGTFSVKGAKETDGIEALPIRLSPVFPAGLFACHTDQGSRDTIVVSWARISAALELP